MASDELKPFKPEARIMQTLASLAARKPLMELDALLEGRDRVSAQQVSFMLRGVGSAMSDYAFTLRQDFDAMRQRADKAEIALAEVRSMFPVKLDKQAFVVNGGEPLRADGDDEFYSATKVNHALAEILQRIDAALAQQVNP